ncbi:MAG TPA: bifunctional phosphoribosylaminoimidazolecarboxamide formyltransferase/IMP cyclohydrolase [Candidatus Omnitrophota bacterium]|nr:bifunctional phosphoribosylaminoimidazolecarboxamide formyltransferase/IMP cyclohydrolase [Candidatus Omnitrophota bacterium]
MIKVKRALISVCDKAGLLDFARGLHSLNIEIISTGGTSKLLKSANIPVREVSDYTGFPEILDGRVKTLHPKIHGGLLALRDSAEHAGALKLHAIGLIDMVVVNLYPFERTIEKKNVSLEEAIENLDIGGPAMLRSGAKNFKSVAVVCNPKKYKDILNELNQNSGILSDTVLFNLAVEAFQLTSTYDRVIYNFLSSRLTSLEFSNFPKEWTTRFLKVQDLRYGENPHQAAAFYRDREESTGLARMKQRHGKELSFNNFLDLNAALEVIKDFENPAAVIIKHTNPTGIAEDKTLIRAYKNAWDCDRQSAFGGIIGLNRIVDLATAKLISKSGFMECILAPGYKPEAFDLLSSKKNLRLLELDPSNVISARYDFKKIQGGLLAQEADQKKSDPAQWKVTTKVKLNKSQIPSLLFGWKAIKNIKSNAIILVKGKKTVGIGCGQPSRIDSTLTAIRKAGKNARGAFLVSEAFLPKVDNVQLAARAGIKVILQPGGSIADEDVIKEADRAKICMVTTGVRHFKH